MEVLKRHSGSSQQKTLKTTHWHYLEDPINYRPVSQRRDLLFRMKIYMRTNFHYGNIYQNSIFSLCEPNSRFHLIKNPFRKFIYDQPYFLATRVSKRANYFVQQSQSNFQDDFWLGKRTKRNFPQVQNIKIYEDDYTDDQHTVLQMLARLFMLFIISLILIYANYILLDSGYINAGYVRLDKQYDQVERK